MTLHRAHPADSLVDAFGVVVHMHFLKSAYAHAERVVDALSDLGVRHVRTRLSGLPAATVGLRAVAARGITIDGVCGELGSSESMDSIIGRVVREYEDPTATFSAFEGINEPNNDGRRWVEQTRLKVRQLHEARSKYGLEQVAIIAPALARVNSNGVEGGDTQGQSQALGDLSQWIDRGNIHVYPRGHTPSTDIDRFMSYQRAVCADRAMWCTEGGYFSAENYVGGAHSTPEEVVREYLPRQLLEHWSRGIERFFCYELLDDFDPRDSDREASFGLLRIAGEGAADAWTPKAQYRAMRNFLALLSDPGPRIGPGWLRMSLDPCHVDLRWVPLAKRNGSFLLCMWRDVSLYDPAEGQIHAVESRAVRVSLAEGARLLVYEPSRQSTPVHSVDYATEIDVTLRGGVVVLAVEPPDGSR